MIEVKDLSVSYGKKKVLNNISFEIKDGTVVGLLGANGAGKSTTMNVLTGYLKQDCGTVLIQGIDMMKEPVKAKKNIGYLPEIPPLYKDMKVIEYLEFSARLKKVKDSVKEVQRVMDLFDLKEKRYEYVKNLSKGWQQRVGFAYCLIGNPSVLILDEPLVGLDPAESKLIRELIRTLAEDHTIILSSHILKEIEELCQDILMLKDGEIVLNDSMKKAKNSGKKNVYRLTIKGDKETISGLLNNSDLLNQVEYVKETEENVYEFLVQAKKNTDIRDNLFGLLVGKRLSVYGIERYESSLEDVFIEINKEEKE